MDLARPYDQARINSFQSPLSSNTHMNSEEVPDAFTPSRSSDQARLSTPREVQLHFPLGAECSPIPGLREDRVECRFGSAKGPELSPGLLGDRLVADDAKPPQHGSGTPPKLSKPREEDSIASESTDERSRRLRPMPDISAFESAAVSSRGERSIDDSATLDSKGVSSSHRFLCPPTPVRTPAWANENSAHAFFAGRQNSLITTKVLLSCPSQVLVGRCSLESSVIDDDSKGRNVHNVHRVSTSNIKKHVGGVYLKHPEKKQVLGDDNHVPSAPQHQILAPPQLTRRVPSPQDVGSVISFSNDFEVLCVLGSGAFADVHKVRSVRDNRLYAVKRNRRQFRGKRDREMALAEVQCMQQLQSTCITEPGQTTDGESAERSSYSLYLLFFYNAWQEDGYLFCQTELCCRDTCRELLDSLRFLWNSSKRKYPSLLRNLPAPAGVESDSDSDVLGRSVPITTIWKICHDIAAGLSHIHSHGVVHNDIKPSNIFIVDHPRFGAMCKIGDFGMAGDIGSHGDGQEGDARYMPPELLKSGTKHPSADVFSLGLTLFEIANDQHVEIPSEGPRWHELRTEGGLQLPNIKDKELVDLIKQITHPEEKHRQTADAILKFPKVIAAGYECDEFLRDYLRDIEEFDRVEDERLAQEHHDEQTPRNGSHRSTVAIRSPSLSVMLPAGPNLLSPLARPFY
jgi:serine/threonine protein kinase